MAIRIKEKGQAFYACAAKTSEDPAVKKLFQDLATLEECHIDCLSALRSQPPGSFPADAAWDPEELAKCHLEAVADTHILDSFFLPVTVSRADAVYALMR